MRPTTIHVHIGILCVHYKAPTLNKPKTISAVHACTHLLWCTALTCSSARQHAMAENGQGRVPLTGKAVYDEELYGDGSAQYDKYAAEDGQDERERAVARCASLHVKLFRVGTVRAPNSMPIHSQQAAIVHGAQKPDNPRR